MGKSTVLDGRNCISAFFSFLSIFLSNMAMVPSLASIDFLLWQPKLLPDKFQSPLRFLTRGWEIAEKSHSRMAMKLYFSMYRIDLKIYEGEIVIMPIQGANKKIVPLTS